MKRKTKKIVFAVFLTVVLTLVLGLFFVWQKKLGFRVRVSQVADQASFKQQQSAVLLSQVESDLPRSPISGLACANALRRPIAVMLSGDARTRPLSGLSEADLIVEMPVTPLGEGSITRTMAVYVCADPPEIGSVRSARHPFIPLALGLDAIYAHWGGSHFALDILKSGVIDNLDALPNPFNAFYRKAGIPMPDNGFTSMSRLLAASKKMGYRLESKFSGYPHFSAGEISQGSGQAKTLTIGYPGQFKVRFDYHPETNSYLRFRADAKEIDKNTGKQVEAKNIVVMRVKNLPLEGQYNDIKIEGSGQAEYYINGERTDGKWSKDAKDKKSKLFFYDNNGQEIKFALGQIWVEIVDFSQSVNWE